MQLIPEHNLVLLLKKMLVYKEQTYSEKDASSIANLHFLIKTINFLKGDNELFSMERIPMNKKKNLRAFITYSPFKQIQVKKKILVEKFRQNMQEKCLLELLSTEKTYSIGQVAVCSTDVTDKRNKSGCKTRKR